MAYYITIKNSVAQPKVSLQPYKKIIFQIRIMLLLLLSQSSVQTGKMLCQTDIKNVFKGNQQLLDHLVKQRKFFSREFLLMYYFVLTFQRCSSRTENQCNIDASACTENWTTFQCEKKTKRAITSLGFLVTQKNIKKYKPR